MMRRFWWRTQGEGKGMSWISWDHLCKTKSLGGMGFKDQTIFNQSLLVMFLLFPESLEYKVFKIKYFPNMEFLSVSLGRHSSYGWRSILHGRESLRKGIR